MKFDWMDCGSGYLRCTIDKPVRITLEFYGSLQQTEVTDMGYITRVAGLYEGHIYGSVNFDAPPVGFNNIDEAKRYVEEQALAGLALKLLTR
jgi:hypothetical protein